MSYLILYQTKKNATVFAMNFSLNCENANRLKILISDYILLKLQYDLDTTTQLAI